MEVIRNISVLYKAVWAGHIFVDYEFWLPSNASASLIIVRSYDTRRRGKFLPALISTSREWQPKVVKYDFHLVRACRLRLTTTEPTCQNKNTDGSHHILQLVDKAQNPGVISAVYDYY